MWAARIEETINEYEILIRTYLVKIQCEMPVRKCENHLETDLESGCENINSIELASGGVHCSYVYL
jgi:hypothetical protein